MRRFTTPLALLAFSALSAFAAAPARADATGSAMADAARRFLAALDEPLRARAGYAFESPERVNWHWIPRERKGLPIKDLPPGPRALAFGLLNTGLSPKGVVRATTIMSLEETLRVDEHGTGPLRDPELYFVSVFGRPEDEGQWGWRVEGHHLALNYTLRDGRVVSATPFMFGSNPAEIRSGPRKGLRNLLEIEEPANRLIGSLNDAQRKEVIIKDVAPQVTTTPNSARLGHSTPEGAAVDRLDASQRRDLMRLMEAYAANFPEPIRADLLAEYARDEPTVHFAWYGPTELNKPHAFRVQGTAFLVDFNDTQNNTNHIHTFYRSAAGDFGALAPAAD